jgi:hypothetical protein
MPEGPEQRTLTTVIKTVKLQPETTREDEGDEDTWLRDAQEQAAYDMSTAFCRICYD